MKTVSSTALAGVADLILRYGVDPAAVASSAGLEVAALTDPDLVLDAEVVRQFFELAANACGDRYFGMEMANYQGLEVLGSVWLLARRAANLEEALKNIGEAMRLHSNAIVLRPVPEAAGVAYCYDTVSSDAVGEVQIIELAFALLCREVRAHAGAKWMPVYVQFRHAAPASLNRHQREFGHSLQFNQDRNALLIDRETLQLPLQTSDHLHGVLQRELHRRQRTVRESFPTRVELVIRNLIGVEYCGAEVVADALGVSVRTLQHKLAGSGSNYQGILDSVRESLARKYLLTSDLSIAEIAELLQFSETSVFSRFFSKRTGLSPREFRKQHRQD